MKWNVWLLPMVLGAALGLVYILPNAGQTAQSAIIMELPSSLAGWSFKQIPPSEDEIKILSKDTEFTKAISFKSRVGETSPDGYPVADRIDLSIVLSGSDINNSIHRPERCMPAQGHRILDSKNVNLHLPTGRVFSAKRLTSVQDQTFKGSKEDVKLHLKCITYYFFVGHDCITNDHLQRTIIDMKDRLVFGRDQRWAYVSVSMWFGKIPWFENEIPESETDEKLSKFITDLSEKQIRWEQIKH